MKLNCIIIDDEPLAADLLKSYAVQTSFLNLIGVFNSALEAIPIISSHKIDLLFLDINMPKLNGLDFSKTLPTTAKVIFTTAYNQYAIEGFKVNALDYLLKPISYSDFLQACNRALDWFKHFQTQIDNLHDDCIFVKSGYRIEKLNFDDILFIENQKDYVRFHLKNYKEPVSSLMNIQELSEKLPSNMFMRVHRSFIVNLNRINTIERNTIVFDKIYIPISETYREKFNEFVKKRFL